MKQIPVRTLRKWRKEALQFEESIGVPGTTVEMLEIQIGEVNRMKERILQLTQILLDQHLIQDLPLGIIKPNKED